MAIQAIRGTKDILPGFVNQWQYVEDIFRQVSTKYGYQELRTPIFEKTEVFSRSIGEGTDIVNKEMYTFLDKGGESITLRPEMTAALVRSVIQNNLLGQSSLLRCWYFGPFFRYERPQKGRFRQFHQYGAECIGSPYPESDAETILLAAKLLKSLGISDYKLLLNTLGTQETRKVYREKLSKYFHSISGELSEDSKARLETNPLRILDSKDERDRLIIEKAPFILDSLDEESSSHFETVKSSLEANNINYEIQPRLVRGLDYYSHTVFEFQSTALGSQDSMGGGGRYNNLFEELGGKQTPAVGFAFGVERLLLVLEQIGKLPQPEESTDIYIITTSQEYLNESQKIAERLRTLDLKVMLDLQRRSVKAQLREANKYGAKFTIIIGEEELKNNNVLIKNMQNSEQGEYPLNLLETYKFYRK